MATVAVATIAMAVEQTTVALAAIAAMTMEQAAVAAVAAVAGAGMATAITVAAVAGNGRAAVAQEGNAEDREKDRDSQNQRAIHSKTPPLSGTGT
jgi:hypothetical protein